MITDEMKKISLAYPGGIEWQMSAKKSNSPAANNTTEKQPLQSQSSVPNLAIDKKTGGYILTPQEIKDQKERRAYPEQLMMAYDDFALHALDGMRVSQPTFYALKFKEKYGKYPNNVLFNEDLMQEYLETIRLKKRENWQHSSYDELWKSGKLEECKNTAPDIYKELYRRKFNREPEM